MSELFDTFSDYESHPCVPIYNGSKIEKVKLTGSMAALAMMVSDSIEEKRIETRYESSKLIKKGWHVTYRDIGCIGEMAMSMIRNIPMNYFLYPDPNDEGGIDFPDGCQVKTNTYCGNNDIVLKIPIDKWDKIYSNNKVSHFVLASLNSVNIHKLEEYKSCKSYKPDCHKKLNDLEVDIFGQIGKERFNSAKIQSENKEFGDKIYYYVSSNDLYPVSKNIYEIETVTKNGFEYSIVRDYINNTERRIRGSNGDVTINNKRCTLKTKKLSEKSMIFANGKNVNWSENFNEIAIVSEAII